VLEAFKHTPRRPLRRSESHCARNQNGRWPWRGSSLRQERALAAGRNRPPQGGDRDSAPPQTMASAGRAGSGDRHRRWRWSGGTRRWKAAVARSPLGADAMAVRTSRHVWESSSATQNGLTPIGPRSSQHMGLVFHHSAPPRRAVAKPPTVGPASLIARTPWATACLQPPRRTGRSDPSACLFAPILPADQSPYLGRSRRPMADASNSVESARTPLRPCSTPSQYWEMVLPIGVTAPSPVTNDAVGDPPPSTNTQACLSGCTSTAITNVVMLRRIHRESRMSKGFLQGHDPARRCRESRAPRSFGKFDSGLHSAAVAAELLGNDPSALSRRSAFLLT